MERRWTKLDGRPTRQTVQPAQEVEAVLDLNQYIAGSSARTGGAGSDNFRFLARVPTAAWGMWAHEWRMKGGLQGTGMKQQDYIILRASTPDYSKFVTTPSGKTGFERQANAIRAGYGSKCLKLQHAKRARGERDTASTRGVTWTKGDPKLFKTGKQRLTPNPKAGKQRLIS